MVSIVTAARDLNRLREISVVLVRHGFGELATRAGLVRSRKGGETSDAIEVGAQSHEQGDVEQKRATTGERIRLVAQELGPSFVKLGQIVSTRTDVMPPELIAELKKLQDDVAPIGFDEVKRQVEQSLGRSIDELYERFDEKPIAAASIGQVHRAVLKTADGPKDVVVKVQRPGVAQVVARDLELLDLLAGLLERAAPETKIYQPRKQVAEFGRSITAELDYGIEADHARRFFANFEGQPHIKFPRVYDEASTRTVLTLEYLEGKKVYDAVAAGFSAEKIAKSTTAIVVKQIFGDGFFHADPHPGNIFILGEHEAPVIGMVDLGMVGRLSPEMRDKTVDLMVAAVRGDSLGVADALYAIGRPLGRVDMQAYRAEASMLAEKYLGRSMKDLKFTPLIRDLVYGATKYGIEMPSDFLLVGRAMITLEGVAREIYPQLNVFEETKPLFFEMLKARYSPERMLSQGWRAFEKLGGAAYDAPQQLREVLEDLRLGRLSVRTESADAPKAIDRFGRRVFSGLLGAGLLIAGANLVAVPGREGLGYALWSIAAAVGFVHFVRGRFK